MQHSYQIARTRWSILLALGLALGVLAGTIVWSTLNLRHNIRAQIASRDGEVLEAVAAAAMRDQQDDASGANPVALDDPSEQIEVVLKVSRLRNVIAVRLFSPTGRFVVAHPAYITPAELSDTDLASLRTLRPVSRFLPRARLEKQDLLSEPNSAPVSLLEVNIPLHEEGHAKLLGLAQFLLDGTSIAREFVTLDRHLARESAFAFLTGGSLLAGGLVLAFRRVRRANRLLVRANRELALAAKTSAIGAVASHLIHGLKNPLSGLHRFVRDHAADDGKAQDSDWQLAVASTERMRSLINRVVTLLQEQQSAVQYELSLAELIDTLANKLQPFALAAGVRFETRSSATAIFANREADLILLILENLIQNALDASGEGKKVSLLAFDEGHQVILEVQDQGPGLPMEVQARLFSPSPSSKPGGSGIGLALSLQLAKHLGADLELRLSSPQGSTFRLTLPRPASSIDRINVAPSPELPSPAPPIPR
jgi:signal transduction histidine kinase